ncbi:MAG: hypothetical protein ACLFNT_14685 [Spirochaetales bacterium]
MITPLGHSGAIAQATVRSAVIDYQDPILRSQARIDLGPDNPLTIPQSAIGSTPLVEPLELAQGAFPALASGQVITFNDSLGPINNYDPNLGTLVDIFA